MSSACRQAQQPTVEEVLATVVRDNNDLMAVIHEHGLSSPNVEETVKEYLDRMNQHNHDVRPFREAVAEQYDLTPEQLPPPTHRYKPR